MNISPPIPEKINIIFRIDENTPPILADPALMKQAMSNLLMNARDAMPQGGDIVVEVRMEKKRIEGRHDELLISVIDNGDGVDPEIKGKLFNPFFTTKPEGTGLGLALVKKIVIMHHGRIEVQSKPGKGSRFTIRLPYRDFNDPEAVDRGRHFPVRLLSQSRV
jgi:signal transduction histidine kinase